MVQEALYEKKSNGLLFTTSNEYIWPKKLLIFMHGLKSAILAIFQKGQYGTFEPMHENQKFFGPIVFI